MTSARSNITRRRGATTFTRTSETTTTASDRRWEGQCNVSQVWEGESKCSNPCYVFPLCRIGNFFWNVSRYSLYFCLNSALACFLVRDLRSPFISCRGRPEKKKLTFCGWALEGLSGHNSGKSYNHTWCYHLVLFAFLLKSNSYLLYNGPISV